jgi:hypothetical protein
MAGAVDADPVPSTRADSDPDVDFDAGAELYSGAAAGEDAIA